MIPYNFFTSRTLNKYNDIIMSPHDIICYLISNHPLGTSLAFYWDLGTPILMFLECEENG